MADYPGGFIGGWMQAGDYLSRQALDKVSLQEAELKLAASQDELNSHRKMVSFAENTLNKVTAEKGGMPPNAIDAITINAQAAFQAGRPEDAMAFLATGAKVQEQTSLAAERSNEILSQRLADFGTELDSAGIDSQEKWSQFWKDQLIKHPDTAQNPQAMQQINGMSSKPYTPELVKSIQDTLQARKARADLDLKAAQTAREKALTAKDEFETKVVEPERARSYRARADALEKTAGKKAGTTKPAELKAAKAQIGLTKVFMNDSDLDAYANDVVAEQHKFQSEGLDEDKALEKAIKRVDTDQVKKYSGKWKGRTPSTQEGRSPDKPKKVLDPSNMKYQEGYWYEIGNNKYYYLGVDEATNEPQFMTEREYKTKGGR